MKRAFLGSSAILAGVLLAATGCGTSGDLSRAETQRHFGVRMAKMNLWREAMFRFRRQVEIDPNDAMAHNNLAVASEANGDYDGAAKEYREALRLDRSNQYIQKNYSRFVEFMQKSRKRDAAPSGSATDAGAATSTQAPPAATPPAATTPAAATPETPPPPPAEPPPAEAPATTTTNPPVGGAR